MHKQALIGILLDKQQVKYIRSIFISSPETLGADLKQKYLSSEEVEKLIDQGDCIYPGAPKIAQSKEIWKNVQPQIISLTHFGERGAAEYRYLFDPQKESWQYKHQSEFKFKRL